jgi:hypothetical protein
VAVGLERRQILPIPTNWSMDEWRDAVPMVEMTKIEDEAVMFETNHVGFHHEMYPRSIERTLLWDSFLEMPVPIVLVFWQGKFPN